MKMLSDIIKVLFESLRLDDEPVNILVDGELCDIAEFYFDDNIMEYVMVLTEGYEYTNDELKERFIYYPTTKEVKDQLTGYTYYCPDKDLLELLTKTNNRADKNAEKYYELKKEQTDEF